MTEAGKMTANTAHNGSRRGIALFLLLLMSLITLHRYNYTMQSYFYSSSDDKVSSSNVVPLVVNYSTSIAVKATVASQHQIISSESLPIYLIDTSNINHTSIAASTWGDIASHWNRNTQYSNLLNLASHVPSLPNQYDNSISGKKRRQIILIHCGPKVGSTTLRRACEKNMKRTCPQIDFATYSKGFERRARAPAGYFGGERLISLINECVDTHYFCVNQITAMDMLPSKTTTTEESDTAIRITISQNMEYIHLFPFRNYNDWVKSAIKQQYDRAGAQACDNAKKSWDNGCQHSHMEIDIRKYPRVDLDRFQDGVVRRMNDFSDWRNKNNEEHTFLLYLHRDLQLVMETVSAMYHLPMLPGTGNNKKGKRPEGTCDESMEEQYHACFSDELMSFRWDLPENQLTRKGQGGEAFDYLGFT